MAQQAATGAQTSNPNPQSCCAHWTPNWQANGYANSNACQAAVIAAYGLPLHIPAILTPAGFGVTWGTTILPKVLPAAAVPAAGTALAVAAVVLTAAGAWQYGTTKGAALFCDGSNCDTYGVTQCDGSCK
jgi:hypothetical protein